MNAKVCSGTNVSVALKLFLEKLRNTTNVV